MKRIYSRAVLGLAFLCLHSSLLAQDCTLQCVDNVIIELLPVPVGCCGAYVAAEDFVVPPEEGCPAYTALSIYRLADVTAAGPDFEPVAGEDTLFFTEDDDETTIVNVYAFDENGNYQGCESFVLVQQHVSCDCEGSYAALFGIIATEEDETLQGVEVGFSCVGSEFLQTTANDGMYVFHFFECDPDSPFVIEPAKDDDLLNGVTTFDIVLTAKHILGTQPFENPYQMLAADVNRSGSISTLDLIFMRKAILNVNDFFPNNTSWRFVPEDYTFPDPQNPWLEEVPETVTLNLDPNNSLNIDFVGIKVGDVNGSAAAN